MSRQLCVSHRVQQSLANKPVVGTMLAKIEQILAPGKFLLVPILLHLVPEELLLALAVFFMASKWPHLSLKLLHPVPV